MRQLLLQQPPKGELSDDLRRAAHRLCAKFLAGDWKRLSWEQLELVQVTGGTTNLLFLAKLPRGTCSESEVQQILIRINCSPDGAIKWLTESVVFSQLSEKGLGPRLHGVFEQGRLEEFIPSRPLTTEELNDPEYSREIAVKLARIHQLLVPLEKAPSFLTDSMDQFFSGTISIHRKRKEDLVIHIPEKYHKWAPPTLNEDSLREEIQLVRSAIEKSGSEVVFCHNDLQENNILLLNEPVGDDKLVFIDFEYACYNYRGFDLANHFVEHYLNYTNKDEPYYSVLDENVLQRPKMLTFCKHYLAELEGKEPDQSRVEALLAETLPFLPVTHFMWSIWSLYMKETSPVTFGYTSYAQDRLGLYYKNKHHLANLLER